MITTARQLKDLKGTNVSVEDVEMIISQIISIPLNDGVSFRIKRISEIMEEADYPGIRVSMKTKFDGVITPLKIDETVINRNVTNTRMRDFYDIYILQKLHGEQLKKQVLWNALVATARKHGTLEQINSGDIREIFDEIEMSSVMENLWTVYQKTYLYASGISWHSVMKSIQTLYEAIYREKGFEDE